MEIVETSLAGVLVLKPKVFSDDRGWFQESWNKQTFAKLGIDLDFVQDNHSCSLKKGTLRGLHFQAPPRAQDKLVRCTRGSILDVAVDARTGSPNYGKWISRILDTKNCHQLLVPKGFLHGFVTLEDETEVQYKCTDTYAPEADGSVRWDSLDIDWGLSEPPIISDKDRIAPPFSEWNSPFQYGAAI